MIIKLALTYIVKRLLRRKGGPCWRKKGEVSLNVSQQKKKDGELNWWRLCFVVVFVCY